MVEFTVIHMVVVVFLSVAVYNHYQRIQELQRQDDEAQELLEQQARRAMAFRHPVEGP